MANTFCSSCKSNGVQTRVEWRPNPDKPGKNKPFDVDKQEWHVCPYYKPKQEFAKTLEPLEQKPIVGNDKVLTELLEIKADVRAIKEAVSNIIVFKELLEAEKQLIAKKSFVKGNNITEELE